MLLTTNWKSKKQARGCSSLKTTENFVAHRQPLPIRHISLPSRQLSHPAIELLQRLQLRAVFQAQQPVGDVDAVIGVDADEMGVEGGVVDFREGETVRDHRLAHEFVAVIDDVGGIEQQRLR
jgi:hypothetical protein